MSSCCSSFFLIPKWLLPSVPVVTMISDSDIDGVMCLSVKTVAMKYSDRDQHHPFNNF